MPITFTADHASMAILAFAAGPVTFADISDHLLQQEQSRILHYQEFVDGRDAIAMFTPAEAHSVVELLRKLSAKTPVGRKAILAPAGVAFGLTRMIEMLSEEFCEVRPFEVEEEARGWLARD
jgi:hypothetical protein